MAYGGALLTRNRFTGDRGFKSLLLRLFMVDVAQPVERLAVTQEDMGSSPIVHPMGFPISVVKGCSGQRPFTTLYCNFAFAWR